MLLYVIEFPNGKRYFGITDRPLHSRWLNHLADSRRGTNRPVCRALKRYPDAKIRALVVGDRDYIHALEQRAIAAYGTTDRQFGYNFGAGGEVNPMLGKKHLPESIAKIAAESRSRVRSAASKAKVSASLKGRPVSEETRAKIRASIMRPEVRAKITGRPRRNESSVR